MALDYVACVYSRRVESSGYMQSRENKYSCATVV
jgi:hypothetical protein